MRRGDVEEWVAAVARELGVDVDDVDIPQVLDLARDAAHNVVRPAAPVTTFLAGYAAGLNGGGKSAIAETISIAAGLAAERPADVP